jgi:hypothetical protein
MVTWCMDLAYEKRAICGGFDDDHGGCMDLAYEKRAICGGFEAGFSGTEVPLFSPHGGPSRVPRVYLTVPNSAVLPVLASCGISNLRVINTPHQFDSRRLHHLCYYQSFTDTF